MPESATRIALLRAVNVGGRILPMAELRDLMAKLGLADARSVLQSGNLVFQGGPGHDAELERQLEAAVDKHLGLSTDFIVRTVDEWKKAIAHNPFPKEAKADPSHLLIVFLKQAPAAAAIRSLRAAIAGPEKMQVRGREAYFVYPAGIGTSKLTIRVIEKHLETRGTARNWNTVGKIAELATG